MKATKSRARAKGKRKGEGNLLKVLDTRDSSERTERERERENRMHPPLFRRGLLDTRTLALVSSKFVVTGLNRGIRVLKRSQANPGDADFDGE